MCNLCTSSHSRRWRIAIFDEVLCVKQTVIWILCCCYQRRWLHSIAHIAGSALVAQGKYYPGSSMGESIFTFLRRVLSQSDQLFNCGLLPLRNGCHHKLAWLVWLGLAWTWQVSDLVGAIYLKLIFWDEFTYLAEFKRSGHITTSQRRSSNFFSWTFIILNLCECYHFEVFYSINHGVYYAYSWTNFCLFMQDLKLWTVHVNWKRS